MLVLILRYILSDMICMITIIYVFSPSRPDKAFLIEKKGKCGLCFFEAIKGYKQMTRDSVGYHLIRIHIERRTKSQVRVLLHCIITFQPEKCFFDSKLRFPCNLSFSSGNFLSHFLKFQCILSCCQDLLFHIIPRHVMTCFDILGHAQTC